MPQPAVRAFTLVELLVVLAVILILLGLLLPILSMVRNLVKDMDSSQRLSAVQQGIAGLAVGGESLARRLHRTVVGPALQAQGLPSGVYDFVGGEREAATKRVPAMLTGDGAIDDAEVPNPTTGKGWYFAATALPACVTAVPWGKPWQYPLDATLYPDPAGFTLDRLCPLRSLDLLAIAGLELDAATYLNDRNPKRPFNDAWGQPLAVGFGFYQPPRGRLNDFGGYDGAMVDRTGAPLRKAEEAYGITRAVYIAVAARGPGTLVTGSSTAALAQAVWDDAVGICRGELFGSAYDPATGAQTLNCFDQVPDTADYAGWRRAKNGVNKTVQGDRRCFLTVPVELR